MNVEDTVDFLATSCGLADSTGALVVVDYTAANYAKYTFTMKMTKPGGTAILLGGDQVQLGGFKSCNKDTAMTWRGNSPEFLFDNSWAWGYGLGWNRGFSHRYDFKERSNACYINADPSNGVALP